MGITVLNSLARAGARKKDRRPMGLVADRAAEPRKHQEDAENPESPLKTYA
jgi:hypothetical protein